MRILLRPAILCAAVLDVALSLLGGLLLYTRAHTAVEDLAAQSKSSLDKAVAQSRLSLQRAVEQSRESLQATVQQTRLNFNRTIAQAEVSLRDGIDESSNADIQLFASELRKTFLSVQEHAAIQQEMVRMQSIHWKGGPSDWGELLYKLGCALTTASKRANKERMTGAGFFTWDKSKPDFGKHDPTARRLAAYGWWDMCTPMPCEREWYGHNSARWNAADNQWDIAYYAIPNITKLYQLPDVSIGEEIDVLEFDEYSSSGAEVAELIEQCGGVCPVTPTGWSEPMTWWAESGYVLLYVFYKVDFEITEGPLAGTLAQSRAETDLGHWDWVISDFLAEKKPTGSFVVVDPIFSLAPRHTTEQEPDMGKDPACEAGESVSANGLGEADSSACFPRIDHYSNTTQYVARTLNASGVAYDTLIEGEYAGVKYFMRKHKLWELGYGFSFDVLWYRDAAEVEQQLADQERRAIESTEASEREAREATSANEAELRAAADRSQVELQDEADVLLAQAEDSIFESLWLMVVCFAIAFTFNALVGTGWVVMLAVPLRHLLAALLLMGEMRVGEAVEYYNENVKVRACYVAEVQDLGDGFMTAAKLLEEYRKFLPAGCLVADDDDEPETADGAPPEPQGDLAAPPSPKGVSSPLTRGGGPTKTKPRVSIFGVGPTGRGRVSVVGSEGSVHRRPNKALGLGDFKLKRATLLLARLDGAGSRKMSDAVPAATKFTATVLDVMQRYEAVVSQVAEWDRAMHVMLSWNAQKSHMMHAAQACNAAVAAEAALARQASALRTNAWTLAVATGQLLAGNVGNDRQRFPLISGAAVGAASALAKLGVPLHVHALCASTVYEQARSELHARVVDTVLMAEGEEMMVYQLLDRPPDDPDSDYLTAFSALRSREYAAAQEGMRRYLTAHGGDEQAMRLLRIAVMLARDDTCLAPPSSAAATADRAFVRREQSVWQEFEALAEKVELPSEMKDLELAQSQSRSEAWGAPTNAPAPPGTTQPAGGAATELHDQIKKAYQEDSAADGANSSCRDGRLPVEFRDAKGRVYHRSDKCLGRGAFGEVWLGMGADGAMVAVKCLRLREVARDPTSSGTQPLGGQCAQPLGGDGDGGWTCSGGGDWTVSGAGGGGGGGGGGDWTVSGGGGGGGGGGDWTVSGGGGGGGGGGDWTVTPSGPEAAWTTNREKDAVGDPKAAADGATARSGVTTLTAAGMTIARRQVQEMVTEVALMTQLRHDNVVQFLGCAVVGSFVLIVMEYLPGGSIQGVMQQFGGKLPQSSVRRFSRDIVQGLTFIHSNNIVHRDLKPGNVLVTHDGQCKLADFGASAELKTAAAGGGGDGGEEGNDNPIGTPMYMPPEQTRGEATTASDIWSLGIVICELCTGKVPWGQVGNILRFMIDLGGPDGPTPTVPEDMPAHARDLARKCLQRSQAARPKARQLLSHPFLLS